MVNKVVPSTIKRGCLRIPFDVIQMINGEFKNKHELSAKLCFVPIEAMTGDLVTEEGASTAPAPKYNEVYAELTFTYNTMVQFREVELALFSFLLGYCSVVKQREKL